MYTHLDADRVDGFYLSEDFNADLDQPADHIVWLSDFLCPQIAMQLRNKLGGEVEWNCSLIM